jgi:predicted Rossmann-fold nucleotide-binding protein
LGLHDKPIYVVNIADYWQPLVALFDQIVAHRFAAPIVPRLIEVVPDVSALMDAISAREPG